MIPFDEEYKMRVQLEAKYTLEAIIDSAEMYDYEKELYLEDVIKELRRRLKDHKGE